MHTLIEASVLIVLIAIAWISILNVIAIKIDIEKLLKELKEIE